MSGIVNIFGWLEEITVKKSPPESFSQDDWDKWNSYMIHRYVSLNFDYIEIANYIQKINPQNKQQIYSIYRELIPKKKIWNKYIKNENKKDYKDLSPYIVKYFECSSKEADVYIDLLGIEEIKNILVGMGVEDKEVKKLLKIKK